MVQELVDVGEIVLQGLTARSLTAAPELQQPPPLNAAEVVAYRTRLQSMDYSHLTQEVEVLSRVFEQLEPALPPFRLEFDTYPHPIVQRRLLALNEVYRRAAIDPTQNYRHQKTKLTVEWGAAGAIIGGIVGYMTKDQLQLGALVGAVLGGVAGRSDLLRDVLTGLSSRVLMM